MTEVATRLMQQLRHQMKNKIMTKYEKDQSYDAALARLITVPYKLSPSYFTVACLLTQ